VAEVGCCGMSDEVTKADCFEGHRGLALYGIDLMKSIYNVVALVPRIHALRHLCLAFFKEFIHRYREAVHM
jgi:hypothetical protein